MRSKVAKNINNLLPLPLKPHKATDGMRLVGNCEPHNNIRRQKKRMWNALPWTERAKLSAGVAYNMLAKKAILTDSIGG